MNEGLNQGLREWQALGLLVLYCLLYRIPLHLSSNTKVGPNQSRDDPSVIKARIRLVTYATAGCSLSTAAIVMWLYPHNSPLHLLGYWPIGPVETLKVLLLNSLLFAGPLYECLLIDGVWEEWADGMQPLHLVLSEWTEWRNIVAGPVTEECLFRSAAVPLLLLSNMSLMKVVFVTPLVFGAAHLYHFYESRITSPNTPLVTATARAIVQLVYTTIFGAYATFLYIRTGSLLAVILVHAMCNALGIRFIWGYVQPYWIPLTVQSNRLILLKWTIPYYFLLIGGVVVWWKSLFYLTESDLALAQF